MFCLSLARSRHRKAAADQSEKLTTQVRNHGATVARVKGCLDLNQSAKLICTQLQGSVQACNVPPAYGVSQTKWISNDKDLGSQNGRAISNLNRWNRSWGDPEQGEARLGIHGDPLGNVMSPLGITSKNGGLFGTWVA